jgi:hypothetical protein
VLPVADVLTDLAERDRRDEPDLGARRPVEQVEDPHLEVCTIPPSIGFACTYTFAPARPPFLTFDLPPVAVHRQVESVAVVVDADEGK